ncbi:PREDICTED: transcription factor FAMA [Camelina sativa]|uniref:Transcription factor FAMA n=1 Tax=Camelina sativa TaxID=90675 RepID=A0ABM0ZBA9_CAMSA|nr:PREDICTED: transcription factor FAMA [Camelina sativa]XP_010513165.1 PREDICTED: transcription factor FAMA [Camelina sativa]
MDKDYSAPNFLGESSGGNDDNSSGMIDYMFNRNLQQQQKQSMPQQQQHQLSPTGFGGTPSFDKMNFADVMQFADFGPKLALNQTRNQDDQETGIDPVYFLKFPVLNDKIEDHNQTQHLMPSHQTSQEGGDCGGNIGNVFLEEREDQDDDNDNKSVQLRFIGGGEEEDRENKNVTTKEVKSKRKRARTSKTSEEVESQRMTHIAVERNRRKQMNEHLRVLRSLMPGSYVQRGDQASIIGGAIEFVRELEQLLQCLESQKRRRILGETGRDMTTTTTSSSSPVTAVANQAQPLIINGHVTEIEGGGGLREETAENKSCLADVEVKLLGFDAMIKILSRRRPGQLIKTIAALEDLHLSILHTNITTMEQTVLYSFNVKITSETRFTAEDIASSIQQIFSFIHANTTISGSSNLGNVVYA